eukprot:gene1421-1546_t
MNRSVAASSRSPSPTRGTMDRPLPVYSDFSHMSSSTGGVGNVRFVVGLREENPDAILRRVFPLTKIIPTEIKEKKPKKKPKKVVEDKNCTRPDCAARKERLDTMKDENKQLRLKVKAVADRVETVRNKVSLNEKSIILAEERNDNLNGQIEEAQNRIQAMTTDVDKAEAFNRTLRKQLQQLQDEIDSINRQTEQQTQELQEMLEDKSERKIIFSKDPRHRDPLLASEVSVLKFPKEFGDEEADSD